MNGILTVKIERAISELRRGGKLVISDINSGISVLLTASELVENHTIDELSKLALSRPSIIISKNRSDAIGINNFDGPCSILIKNNWTVINNIKGSISKIKAGEFNIDKNNKKLVSIFSSLKNSNSLNKFKINTKLVITIKTNKSDLK